jgi:hypothetical protein
VNAEQLKPGYERVFTVSDYYDGPLRGIADYNGQPHFFDLYHCTFDESANEYSYLYRLTPVPRDVFRLALEDWEIWRRWEAAFHTGKATLDSYPALPHDAVRYAEIKPALDAALRSNLSISIVRQGIFEAIRTETLPKGAMRPFQVRWIEP